MKVRQFVIILITLLYVDHIYAINPERQKGMRYAVEGHFAVGASSVENAMNFGFTASIGYQLNSRMFLGIGGGYINYPQYADGNVDNAFPIYADVKYNFNDNINEGYVDSTKENKICGSVNLKIGFEF